MIGNIIMGFFNLIKISSYIVLLVIHYACIDLAYKFMSKNATNKEELDVANGCKLIFRIVEVLLLIFIIQRIKTII